MSATGRLQTTCGTEWGQGKGEAGRKGRGGFVEEIGCWDRGPRGETGGCRKKPRGCEVIPSAGWGAKHKKETGVHGNRGEGTGPEISRRGTGRVS